VRGRSDHCPAMKGIETRDVDALLGDLGAGSDHCPAMKGIETPFQASAKRTPWKEATTAPQ